MNVSGRINSLAIPAVWASCIGRSRRGGRSRCGRLSPGLAMGIRGHHCDRCQCPLVLGLTAAYQRRAETAKATRQALQGTNGRVGDILPVAAEADLEVRVHRAVLALPYIHRDAEEKVARLLNAGQPVLLVGSSMVGKTKLAATVIRSIFANRRVIIPDTKEALGSMDTANATLREMVIFLDDFGTV